MKRKRLERPILCGGVLAGLDPKQFVDPEIDITGKTIVPYSIAHKGTIAPTIVGLGKQFLEFSEKALNHVLDKLPLGTKAFDQHKPENLDPLSHEGRPALASVVGKGLARIKNKVHSIAVLAFDTPAQAKNFPSISMESEAFHYGPDKVVRYIEDITGLALLPRGVRPAFPDAGQVGAPVLCNYDEHSNGTPAGTVQLTPAEIQLLRQQSAGAETMTFEQAKQLILSGGHAPGAVFDSDTLIGDVDVKDGQLVFDGGDKAVRRVLQKKLEGKAIVDAKELDELRGKAQKFSEIEKPFAEFQKKTFVEQALNEIPKIAETRNLNESQKKFLTAEANLSKIQINGDFNTALQGYVDSELARHKDLVSAGLIITDAGSEGNESSSSSGSADGSGDSSDLVKLV